MRKYYGQENKGFSKANRKRTELAIGKALAAGKSGKTDIKLARMLDRLYGTTFVETYHNRMRYYAEIRVGDIDEHYVNRIVEGRTAQSAFNNAVKVAKKAHDLQDEKYVIIDVFDNLDESGSIISELVTLRK